jgi:hypothetical protein
MTMQLFFTTALAAWLSCNLAAGMADELRVTLKGGGISGTFPVTPTETSCGRINWDGVPDKSGDMSGGQCEITVQLVDKSVVLKEHTLASDKGIRSDIIAKTLVPTDKVPWTGKISQTTVTVFRVEPDKENSPASPVPPQVGPSIPVSNAETTEMTRFVEMARAALAKDSGGKSLSPVQLAAPDALGKDWKLYSSQEYGGAESGIHELLYTAQEPMLVLANRDEIVLKIKVFSTVPAAREWALQTALAGAAPMADLVNRAKNHFGKTGLPGDFCFGPDLFVRGNVVVEYGNDVPPIVPEHVDASLLKLASITLVIKRGDKIGKHLGDGTPLKKNYGESKQLLDSPSSVPANTEVMMWKVGDGILVIETSLGACFIVDINYVITDSKDEKRTTLKVKEFNPFTGEMTIVVPSHEIHR